MTNRRNYYRILHVGPDAPTAVIQASYRALMQRLRMHPDLGGDHDQAALINEAYDVLSDQAKRRAYDRTLAQASEQRQAPRPTAPPHASPPPPPASASSAGAPRAASPSQSCPFCAAPFRRDDDLPERTCVACGSALALPPKHTQQESSRRHIERLPRSMPVTFHRSSSRDVACPGTTEDVSLHGMRLLSSTRLAIDERLRVECAFCSAVAIVRSVGRGDGGAQGGWQYGLEFVTLRVKRERGGLFSTVA